MPISALGSRATTLPRRCAGVSRGIRGIARRATGFTLIELLIVIAIVAVSASLMTLALRDSSASRLEEEGARLVALLEMARAEARVAGSTVRWMPVPDSEQHHFRFVGISEKTSLPTRWLDAATRAQVSEGVFVVLGPQAILPPQRVVLSLGQQQLEVATDGLSPFAVGGSAAAR
jgi:general secretion pathway protein H